MNPFENIHVDDIVCKVEHSRWIGRTVNENTILHVVGNCVVGKAKVAGHIYQTDTIQSRSRDRGVVECASTDARSKCTVSSSGSIDVNPTNDVVVSQ